MRPSSSKATAGERRPSETGELGQHELMHALLRFHNKYTCIVSVTGKSRQRDNGQKICTKLALRNWTGMHGVCVDVCVCAFVRERAIRR